METDTRILHLQFSAGNPLSQQREFFIQFRDEQGKVSPAYSSMVNLNLWPMGHYAVTANGGQSTIFGTNAVLEFEIPFNAVSMRYIVEDGINNIFTQLDFELLPFLGLHPTLREALNPDFPVLTYPVYVQYIDANGNMSQVFRSELVVDNCLDGFGIFAANAPLNQTPVAGAPQVLNSSSFTMAATFPPSTTEMLIFEEGREEEASWQQARNLLDFRISGDGENLNINRTYYVRFRDLNRNETCTYRRSFSLDLFPMARPPMVLEYEMASVGVPNNLVIDPPATARDAINI